MDVDLFERMDDQVVFVSGGNRGLGAVTAAALVDLGATVVVGVREPAGFEAPDGQTVVQLDVHDEASVQDAASTVADRHGRLDVLVNNAGIAPGINYTLADEPTDEIDDVLATNVRGTMLLTKHTLPLLLESEHPRIVNVSSGMGALVDQDGAAPAYRISKTALNGLTAYLHGEYHAAHGLIANSVCPGWVRTELGGPGADRSPEEGAETIIWLTRFTPGAPSGHFWRDREIIPW